jgi:2-aminoethylphosphonate-pyruvate transaminase
MLLLIPGPVMTHPSVRAAANADIAPWDSEERARIAHLLERLRDLAGGDAGTHVALPLPGSGHFIIEAAIRSFVRPEGGILIPETGQYADRMIRLAREIGRRVVTLPAPLDRPIVPEAVAEALAADPGLSHVGLIYSETSTGILHDPEAIGTVVRAAGRRMILDAVSAFGALPIRVADHPEIDGLVFTPNKCLEALPGFSVSVSPTARLEEARGKAGSWSFDLGDLYDNGRVNGFGSSRFTPSAQSMAALAVALDRLEAEGGPPARLARYRANMTALRGGLEEIGMGFFLPPALQGPIVLNVRAPDTPEWDLQRFVDALKARGVLISNFRNTEAPSFRVGAIGAITPADMRMAVAAMSGALHDLGLAPFLGDRR